MAMPSGTPATTAIANASSVRSTVRRTSAHRRVVSPFRHRLLLPRLPRAGEAESLPLLDPARLFGVEKRGGSAERRRLRLQTRTERQEDAAADHARKGWPDHHRAVTAHQCRRPIAERRGERFAQRLVAD